MKGVDELAAITAALSAEQIAFLDQQTVPFCRLSKHGAIVVHAGILPTWTDLDAVVLDKAELSKLSRIRYVTGCAQTKLTVELECPYDVPDDAIDDAVYRDGRCDRNKYTLLKKVVRPKGSFLALGEQKQGDPLWAEVYDGRFGHVFFGHEPFMQNGHGYQDEPRRFPHATGLDLGCVFGGRLAAAILEEGRMPQYVSVPGRKFAERCGEEE